MRYSPGSRPVRTWVPSPRATPRVASPVLVFMATTVTPAGGAPPPAVISTWMVAVVRWARAWVGHRVAARRPTRPTSNTFRPIVVFVSFMATLMAGRDGVVSAALRGRRTTRGRRLRAGTTARAVVAAWD